MAPLFTPSQGIIGRKKFLNEIMSQDFPIVKKKDGTEYYNIPSAFDIETSSFYQNGDKKSTMYIWQFGLFNYVTTGRTWDEFLEFIEVLSTILGLSSKRRIIVYVHNLAYEFQFIRKKFDWDKVFFLDERKPVYALCGGIEFRCALKLSSKSLASTAKDLQKYKVEKLVGDLDYSLIRTSITPLSEKELKYCENDIRILLSYIQEKIENDGSILKIPLTNTGYVRNFCRTACFKRYGEYKRLMNFLQLCPEEYSQLKRAFCGGFTHASASYSGKVLEHVGSFDLTSSYPTVMVSEKFPMSPSRLVTEEMTDDALEYYMTKYCCMFDIKLIGLSPKVWCDHPLSVSKSREADGVVADNGRVVFANSLITTMTEQDYKIMSKFYEWEDCEISNFRIYDKGYLPKDFVLSILELYGRKTTLKDVEGEEINYMIGKNMINSAFGMTVTDVVREIYEYKYDVFTKTKPDVVKAISDYNSNSRRFLFYPWGVWVTAYARVNLFDGILACAGDYVYGDTDSIKILNPESHYDYIEDYNKRILHKLEAVADFYHIDKSKFSPVNKKGVEKPLGVWNDEGIYDAFKTIGAKRYMTLKNGEYSLTVAGVNKKKAMEYILSEYRDPFEALSPDLSVPSEYSGRLISTYIDEPCDGIVRDYIGTLGEYHEDCYIHMEPSDYTINFSEEYKMFLDWVNGTREDSW